jgi:hypothetical protein
MLESHANIVVVKQEQNDSLCPLHVIPGPGGIGIVDGWIKMMTLSIGRAPFVGRFVLVYRLRRNSSKTMHCTTAAALSFFTGSLMHSIQSEDRPSIQKGCLATAHD